MLDYVQNVVHGTSDTTISKYDYRTDTLGRRKDVVHTGSAFGQSHLWEWMYNDRSEVQEADRYQGDDPENPGNIMTPGAYGWNYDPIGNRKMSMLDANETNYCANNLNQYKATDDEGGTCPTPATPTETFTYDDDGNLTQDGARKYTWDAENRLIRVEPSADPPGFGSRKTEYAYDHMNRRVRKQAYLRSGGQWVKYTDQKFVYDQWNVVMVLDGTASNTVVHKYTWGLDLSGLSGTGASSAPGSAGGSSAASGIHGAGGIGGLLAWEKIAGGTSRYWYCYDGNGNVGQLLTYTASGPSVSTTPAAKYEYDAYGQKIVETDTASTGNAFQFSTKWFDLPAEGGLGYWGYRYYSPRLGRWANLDPLMEIQMRRASGGIGDGLFEDLQAALDVKTTPVIASAGLAAAYFVDNIEAEDQPYIYNYNDAVNRFDAMGLLPAPMPGTPCQCPGAGNTPLTTRGRELRTCRITIIRKWGIKTIPGSQCRDVNLYCPDKGCDICRWIKATPPMPGPWSPCAIRLGC